MAAHPDSPAGTAPGRSAAGPLARLLDAVFPPLCPVTGAETGAAGTLAPEAWRGLAVLAGAPRCRSCGRLLPGAGGPAAELACDPCTRRPRPWAAGAAAVSYEGAGRAIVLALKHRDRLDLAPMLAARMQRAAPDIAAGAELIVPVPLHWRRLLARRFNQSAEIARALARRPGVSARFAPRLLRRVRATPPQAGGAEARAANLAGAIRAARGAAPRLSGRRVLLVDDVMTTGATLEAAAEACLAAGAARVDVLVGALVPLPDRPYVAGEDIADTQEIDPT